MSLLQPRKPGDKNLEDQQNILTEKYTHKSNRVECFMFYSRMRGQGKTVTVYEAELKRLTKYFSSGNVLEDVLWDILVYGFIMR